MNRARRWLNRLLRRKPKPFIAMFIQGQYWGSDNPTPITFPDVWINDEHMDGVTVTMTPAAARLLDASTDSDPKRPLT